ncbi:MAG: SRPBCC domain-containing protein [bacterium]|nr:SRPBCC domain-containing protein [bacterium]
MTIYTQVLSVSPEKEFRWKGSLGIPGVMDGEHYFILQSDGKSTLLIHGENFKGLLAWPFHAFLGEKTKAGFNAMNQALKEKCEAA